MALQTAAGATVSISAALPGAHDAAGFALLTWVQIKKVTGLAEIGDSYNATEFQPLDEATDAYKGSLQLEDLTYSLGQVADDAGQVILATALGGSTKVSFMVTYPDATIAYFSGLVTAMKYGASDANGVVAGNFTVKKVGLAIHA